MEICLDLGCGSRKRAGHIGLDKVYLDGVDLVCDIERGLPIKSGCVDKIYSNYLFEHIQDMIFLFQEIYRVCRNGAEVEFVVPYYTSINAFKDPTHRNFFTEETFRYFSKDDWYGSDYKINTNFKVVRIKYHYSNLIKWLPFKKYLRRYLFNVVGAMEVILEVKK
ncbi:MAG: methyltransferase domain-containing protein [Candidatus Omnitrophota bacterium]